MKLLSNKKQDRECYVYVRVKVAVALPWHACVIVFEGHASLCSNIRMHRTIAAAIGVSTMAKNTYHAVVGAARESAEQCVQALGSAHNNKTMYKNSQCS